MDKNLVITQRHILAFRRLNQKLEDFVKVGFRDEINFQKVNADLMLGLVAERALTDLERLAAFPERTRKKGKTSETCISDPDPLEVAYERYITFIAKHSVSAVSDQPPADVGLIPKERIDFILNAHDLVYPNLVVLPDEADPVVRAWNMARANRRRALQRVGAFFFLASQTHPSIYGDLRKRLDDEGTAAVQFLFSRAADFRASELKFAVLLGGAAQALTRADIVRDSFGPDMAIIHYLQPDEHHPGRYFAEDADALREQVNAYAGTEL